MQFWNIRAYVRQHISYFILIFYFKVNWDYYKTLQSQILKQKSPLLQPCFCKMPLKNIGKESNDGTDKNIPFLPLCPNSHSRPTKSEEIELTNSPSLEIKWNWETYISSPKQENSKIITYPYILYPARSYWCHLRALAESEEELKKSLLIKVKEGSENLA